jgi:hypothetical protein
MLVSVLRVGMPCRCLTMRFSVHVLSCWFISLFMVSICQLMSVDCKHVAALGRQGR